MTDLILDRINFRASSTRLEPIPWPEGLGPTKPASIPTQIPTADVLVVTYTAAEGQALADVLSPGHPSEDWAKYTTNWSQFVPQLTERSPAKWSKCLGKWAVTQIGNKTVVLFKSELHLATDGKSLPIRQLWRQLIAAVKPGLIITTGTAGGIGASTVLGDVCVTNSAKFNCRGEAFADEPWSQSVYEGATWKAGPHLAGAEKQLLAVNAAKLKPIATRDPVISTVVGKPGVETVGYFGFAAPGDPFGIVADDPSAKTEEMDDAVLPLALDGSVAPATPWLSIRNASDPEVPRLGDLKAEEKWASGVYSKYGYYTTVGSAITCWAVIADL